MESEIKMKVNKMICFSPDNVFDIQVMEETKHKQQENNLNLEKKHIFNIK